MTESSVPDVGLRIRALREQQGLSLRALAGRCGLSINAISRIERGEHSPTVSSLHLLATALGVPITEFFRNRDEQATVFVKGSHRLRAERNGVTMESLGIGLRQQQIDPFLIRLEQDAGNTDEPVAHAGQEFVYCLEGQIEYRVGAEAYRLEPGDSLLLEAAQPHCFQNIGASPAVFLLIFHTAEGNHLAYHSHM